MSEFRVDLKVTTYGNPYMDHVKKTIEDALRKAEADPIDGLCGLFSDVDVIEIREINRD